VYQNNRISTNKSLRKLVDEFHFTKKDRHDYKNVFVGHYKISGENNCSDLRECALKCYKYFGGKVIRGPYTPPSQRFSFPKDGKIF